MKQTLLLAAGLALTLLTGCVVTSVYPYYTPKDVVFDPALLGVWGDPASTNADRETWTFAKLDDQTYKLVVAEKDKKTEFDARLFKLKQHTFLDCLPRERADYAVPGHMLMKVECISPALELRLLDYDWLGKLLEKNPKTIRHTVVPKPAGESGDGGQLVLTADTAELQKFILKHASNTNAFGEVTGMKRLNN